MKKIAIVSLCVALAVLAGACSGSNIEPAALPSATFALTETDAPASGVSVGGNGGIISEPVNTSISFRDGQASVDGDGARADGADVTITDGGRYTVTGQTTSGSITVDAPDQHVELVLSGASISSSAGPAILVLAAQDPMISLADGTESTARGGGEPYDAAIYGAVSFSIGGTGSLYVYGTGLQGILSMQDLTIERGIISVEAMEDGIRATGDGRNTVRVNDGEIYIDCQGSSFNCDGSLIVRGGQTFAFGGMAEHAGLKAGQGVTVNGGSFLATGGELTMPDGTGQKYLAYKVAEQPAGQDVTISDGSRRILDTEVPVGFTTLVYSSPDILDNTTYSFSIGGMQFAAGTTANNATASATPAASSQRQQASAPAASATRPRSTPAPSYDPDAITPVDTPEPEPTEHPDFSDPDFSGDEEPEDQGANYDEMQGGESAQDHGEDTAG